jgi:hypothetical protein
VLRTEADRIIANPSVVEYNEITAENIGDFHFHGDPAAFPLTAVIVQPHDQRAGTARRTLSGRRPSGADRAHRRRLGDLVETVFARSAAM